jgi:hypothetical protein
MYKVGLAILLILSISVVDADFVDQINPLTAN